MTRKLDFEGIHNFRDFGGYDTADGRGLKWGKLLRSASHGRATDTDLQRIRDLDVSAILDLREGRERQNDPSRRWDGFDVQVIENDLSSSRQDWFIAAREAEANEQWVVNHQGGFYREIPVEPRYVDLFSRFLHHVAETDRPVIVHCAAGKDRTGLICAFTHHIAGVHPDDIMADYLLTNDPEHIEKRVAYLGPVMEKRLGKPMSECGLRAAAMVREEYLNASFEMINHRFGSLDGYLEQVLGIDHARRELIRERILN